MKALALALALLAAASCASPPAFTQEEGLASWYGGKFQGRRTSSGEVFDTNLLTAAHKTLPFGTFVKVVNLDNGLFTVVRINDRGPFIEGRIIDLSRAAAEDIDMIGTGVARVRIEAVFVPGDRLAIQVGSFGVEANAARARGLLEKAGYLVSTERTALGAIRVLVRGVAEQDVEKTRLALAALGFERTLVRQEQPTDAGDG